MSHIESLNKLIAKIEKWTISKGAQVKLSNIHFDQHFQIKVLSIQKSVQWIDYNFPLKYVMYTQLSLKKCLPNFKHRGPSVPTRDK